jgi:nicotinate-nucleotide adenylyltransferase
VHLAVFGGTFDPPHNGHLALCLFARELLDIDRTLVSVSNNPLKQIRGAADVHRMRMAELLCMEINQTGEGGEVSMWEQERKGPSYTVDLMRYLHSLYPADKLTLLVGEDSFREFPFWKESEMLYALCDIVVFSRASASFHSSLDESMKQSGSIRTIDFTSPVSSTAVRNLVAEGQSISRLVPSSVRRYIIEHELYRHVAGPATLTQERKHQES